MPKQQAPEIIEVSFGVTANLGNYESARVDLKARVNKGQDWQPVLEELRALVAGEIATERHVSTERRGPTAGAAPFQGVTPQIAGRRTTRRR